MGFFPSEFEYLLEEATSEFMFASKPDLARNLELCDWIKSRRVSGREAMRALKRRLQHRNPTVRMLALDVTDSAFMNTSPAFLKELVSREFVDCLIAMCREESVTAAAAAAASGTAAMGSTFATMGTAREVMEKARDRVQFWSLLTERQSGLGYLREAFEQARREGIRFPMLSPEQLLLLPGSLGIQTVAPPEWTDSSACERCHESFGVLQRKHHCRRCGKTFCQACSEKRLELPEMGFYEAVRVCEPCFAQRAPPGATGLPPAAATAAAAASGRRSTGTAVLRSSGLNYPASRRPASTTTTTPIHAKNTGSPTPPDNFDEDLAKAIALSLQESSSRSPSPSPSPSVVAQPATTATAGPAGAEGEYDEEAAIAAAIAQSLKDAAAPSTADVVEQQTRNNSNNSTPVQKEQQQPQQVPTLCSNFVSTSSPPVLSVSPIAFPRSSPPPPLPLPLPPSSFSIITPIERENVQLFGELISKMSPHDEELEEPEFLKLARDMAFLRDRLRLAIDGTSPSDRLTLADLNRVYTGLSGALASYERLSLISTGPGAAGVEEEEEASVPYRSPKHQQQLNLNSQLADLTLKPTPSSNNNNMQSGGKVVVVATEDPRTVLIPSAPRSETGTILYDNSISREGKERGLEEDDTDAASSILTIGGDRDSVISGDLIQF